MRDRSPVDMMLWFMAALIFGHLIAGCHLTAVGRRVQRWYQDQWDRDAACLEWCALELQLDKSLILATQCVSKECARPCRCMLLGRSL